MKLLSRGFRISAQIRAFSWERYWWYCGFTFRVFSGSEVVYVDGKASGTEDGRVRIRTILSLRQTKDAMKGIRLKPKRKPTRKCLTLPKKSGCTERAVIEGYRDRAKNDEKPRLK